MEQLQVGGTSGWFREYVLCRLNVLAKRGNILFVSAGSRPLDLFMGSFQDFGPPKYNTTFGPLISALEHGLRVNETRDMDMIDGKDIWGI